MTMRPTTNPEALRAELYHFQKVGARWLASSPTALLGDEMGLGKTIQAIHAADICRMRRIVIVAPTSAIYNWREEFYAFSQFHRRIQVVDNGAVSIDADADVVITTPGLIRRGSVRAALWARGAHDLVIVDEAQNFKSPDARQTQALYGPDCTLRSGTVAALASRVWLLTGTPVKNHAGELWSHVHALRPDSVRNEHGVLMEYDTFVRRYCITKVSRFGVRPIGNRRSMLDEMRTKLIRPFILRRLKKDVLRELPPIRFDLVTIGADHIPEELGALEDVFADAIGDILAEIEAGADGDDLLRRINARTANIPGGLARLRHLTGMLKAGPTVTLVAEHFAEAPESKVILFALHLGVIDALRNAAFAAGWSPAVIVGATPARDRQGAIKRFQTDPKCRVFIGQIHACSTAITLTAAAEMMFVEAAWCPSDNAQGAARFHRIGQTRGVRVRFLALANSIDTAVMRVLTRKVKTTSELFN